MKSSISDVNEVIFECPPPAILMEATFATLSFNQTSMVPHFVAVKTKSLLTAMRWISSPVENDPITVLVEREITFHTQK